MRRRIVIVNDKMQKGLSPRVVRVGRHDFTDAMPPATNPPVPPTAKSVSGTIEIRRQPRVRWR
jgi:hypothetical protein